MNSEGEVARRKGHRGSGFHVGRTRSRGEGPVGVVMGRASRGWLSEAGCLIEGKTFSQVCLESALHTAPWLPPTFLKQSFPASEI